MTGLFEKIRRFFNSADTAVAVHDTPAVPLPDGAFGTQTIDFDAAEPTSVSALDDRASADTGNVEIDESLNYWWLCPDEPEEEGAVFEAILGEELLGDLKTCIESGTFTMIALPAQVMSVLRILDTPNFSYEEVAGEISQSPVLVGDFLRVANSAAFQRGVKVTDIRTFLPRMGPIKIRGLLYIDTLKMELANHPMFKTVSQQVIDHSYATALIAGYLSQRYYPNPEHAFMAGLMHDIGKLVILKELTFDYSHPDLNGVELNEGTFREIFPVLHETAGEMLAIHWDLPEEIVGAIRHHHDFYEITDVEDSGLTMHLAAVINLSDHMARILGRGRPLGGLSLFELPATHFLEIVPDADTIEFFDPIPGLLP